MRACETCRGPALAMVGIGTAPGWLARAVYAAGPERRKKVLVAISLRGAADGLTIRPTSACGRRRPPAPLSRCTSKASMPYCTAQPRTRSRPSRYSRTRGGSEARPRVCRTRGLPAGQARPEPRAHRPAGSRPTSVWKWHLPKAAAGTTTSTKSASKRPRDSSPTCSVTWAVAGCLLA